MLCAEECAECEGSPSILTLWTSIPRQDQVVAGDVVEGFDTRSVAQSAECSEVFSNDVVAEAGAECEGTAPVSTL